MSQAVTDTFDQQNFAALPNKRLVRLDGSCRFIVFDQAGFIPDLVG
jgi:hypothetical protein